MYDTAIIYMRENLVDITDGDIRCNGFRFIFFDYTDVVLQLLLFGVITVNVP